MEKSDAAPDPHPLGIDALIDYASSPDASLVPTPGPLILTREQGTALLLALHRSGVGQAHRLTGAGRPADGDPPPGSRIARPPLTDEEIEAALEPLRRDIEQAGGRLEVRYEEPAPQPKEDGLARIRAARTDLLLFAKQFEQAREADAVRVQWERASAAAAKFSVGHGKSLLWGGLLEELERAKEPPQLPPSPVVQAALVVEQSPHALRSGSWIDFDPGTVGKADLTRVTTWRAEPNPDHPGKARYTLLDVRDADPEE